LGKYLLFKTTKFGGIYFVTIDINTHYEKLGKLSSYLDLFLHCYDDNGKKKSNLYHCKNKEYKKEKLWPGTSG
jgi:hypothetical protein